jgi:hypothetical protein
VILLKREGPCHHEDRSALRRNRGEEENQPQRASAAAATKTRNISRKGTKGAKKKRIVISTEGRNLSHRALPVTWRSLRLSLRTCLASWRESFRFRCRYAVNFGATVKAISSLICSTSSKPRKHARRSLICFAGSSGSASGRNLRSCSSPVINRLKWPRW